MTRKNSVVLEGKNIFHDKHGRVIYYIKRQKRGYRIPAEKYGTFKTLEPRFLYGILMFIFSYFLFKFNAYICIGLSLIAFGFMEWRFRKFLSNCTIIENYIPNNEINSSLSSKTSYRDLAIRSGLYILLGVLLIVNAYTSKNLIGNKELQFISNIVGVFVIFFGLKYVGVMFKKKQIEKNAK